VKRWTENVKKGAKQKGSSICEAMIRL